MGCAPLVNFVFGLRELRGCEVKLLNCRAVVGLSFTESVPGLTTVGGDETGRVGAVGGEARVRDGIVLGRGQNWPGEFVVFRGSGETTGPPCPASNIFARRNWVRGGPGWRSGSASGGRFFQILWNSLPEQVSRSHPLGRRPSLVRCLSVPVDGLVIVQRGQVLDRRRCHPVRPAPTRHPDRRLSCTTRWPHRHCRHAPLAGPTRPVRASLDASPDPRPY